ncbi:MAG: hypothetical protein RLZZ461_393 [Planctomycetota bacterium]
MRLPSSMSFRVTVSVIGVSLMTILGASGCTNRQVKVVMRAGDAGPERTFETNRADADERSRIAEAYESGPLRRVDGEDGVRFEATFAERDLPSEVGNRNGWAALPSAFGTAYLYVEQFGAERDDWTAFRDRMDAGDLWLRLGARFIESRIEDEAARTEWRRFADEELVPDLLSAFLRFNANGLVQQGQRIDTRFRPPAERGPRTDDEWFQIQVFTPLVAFAIERGWVEPEEGQLVLLSGVDGWASAGERAWSRKNLADPIVARFVQRFKPDAEPGTIGPENKDLVLLGLAFLWWVNTSDDAAAVMLESPAIPERDKERLRRGDRLISIPGPFGIPIGGGAKPLDSEVVLETGVAPFVTNGTWDESLGTIRFSTKVYPADQRRRLATPVFHASWAVPDADVQRAIFGEVVLSGQDLAECASWERMLDEETQAAWRAAVVQAIEQGDPAPLRSILDRVEGDGDDDLPAPTALQSIVPGKDPA